MADPGFEAFLWSLTQQESGGNYSAVGPPTPYGRAYGRYQVLAPNVGPWTAKYYGKRLTPQQFLNNKAAQDAVVRGVLGGYYKKYGARGAAAMWYSGQSNPNKTYGNPPVYKYVNSVMARAGSYSGQSTGGGGYTSGGPVKVALDKDELAEQYGLSSALINSSKELKSLFNQAVSGGWSAAKFQAKLKNSKWWKTQSSSLRKYITTKFTDPATHKQKWAQAQYKVNQLAVAVGLGSQIKSGKSSKLLKSAIYNSLALGWSDERIKDWLGTKATLHDGIMWGEAGEAFDKFHELAYLNGMKYSQDWYKKNAVAVVSGKTTLETEEAKIRAQAAARYGAYKDQILAGQNVMDLAAPYIKSLSTLLELPETDVDLFDKHVAKAMTSKPASGTAAGTQMPLWEFENAVRADPLWRKTNNARESMMSVARQVAKDFGLAY
ncbi:hypothetical protein [Streptomyces himalayensis]|uniref:Transglycosylase SLT domain-containing protein n=1 Tax=Streptomyces himalayensis subsp. himalayensis TaxID=2756131 RepID=A0A7W0DVE8_9ACTN|nr:hypothetical protein [Streptomyces himalayensis]MBA2951433.1 hypothetical protein [Streptomyces himalayensis subsp. himalayensis]